MWLRLRQIALLAHKLTPVAHDMHDVAFRSDIGTRVKSFELENAIFPVGNQFIEVVAPIRAPFLRTCFTDESIPRLFSMD
jgi:hypothetical protein